MLWIGTPAEVLRKAFPDVDAILKEKGWKHLARIDQVYDSSKAVKQLGWNPKYTFEKTVGRLVRGEQWKSDLTARVGRKGYHAVSTGVYARR